MTRLRQMMLEELERRSYSEGTTRRYLRHVELFAQHFGKSPDKLGPDHLRIYQAYLLKVRKLDPGTVENHVSALRFLFIRTLGRHEFRQFLPYPKVCKKLPKILGRDEAGRLIDASSGLFERTLLMVLYGTGMRRSEVARLKIDDIDSQRMVIHVVNGKGGKDRDLPLSPKLLETLRAYWRWLKPQTFLFPSRNHRAVEQPITDKIVWRACVEAARRAGIRKTVKPSQRQSRRLGAATQPVTLNCRANVTRRLGGLDEALSLWDITYLCWNLTIVIGGAGTWYFASRPLKEAAD